MAAEQAKERGNRAFAAGRFSEAAADFSEAIAVHARQPATPINVHVYHSNRSAAYLKLGDAPRALADAELCVALKPDWPKGYSRQGAALYQLGRFADAQRAYQAGLTRDGANPALLEGLRAAGAKLAAPARAASAPRPAPTSLRAFLVGDAGAAFRLFQAGLRALLLALFVLYWLGVAGAFGNFFLLALLHYASFLAFTHGRPKLDAAYGQRLVLDPATQSLFFALVFWVAAQPPHGLALLPVLLIEAVHLCAWLATLLGLLGLADSPLVAAATSRALVPLAAAIISEPGFPALTPAAKWAALYRKMPTVAANIEVALGLALVVELLSPARNVLLVVLYWQVLRVRYMISPPLQDAFRRLHAALLSVTSHPRCPAFLRSAYTKLHAFAWKMVEVNTQQQAGAGAGAGAGGLASRCTVM
jgi:tetratricopeptide (TPR) repeat protein